MVNIQAQGQTITCPSGENLRRVLIKHGVKVHNGQAALINCRGIGTCGTCAVEIEGQVSEKNWREKTRLSIPPHSAETTRRLACQIQVLEDIKVTKYNGFWGQGSQRVWTPEG